VSSQARSSKRTRIKGSSKGASFVEDSCQNRSCQIDGFVAYRMPSRGWQIELLSCNSKVSAFGSSDGLN